MPVNEPAYQINLVNCPTLSRACSSLKKYRRNDWSETKKNNQSSDEREKLKSTSSSSLEKSEHVQSNTYRLMNTTSGTIEVSSVFKSIIPKYIYIYIYIFCVCIMAARKPLPSFIQTKRQTTLQTQKHSTR